MRKKYGIGDSSKVFAWALFLPQVLSFLIVLIFSLFKDLKELSNFIPYILIMACIAQISFGLIFWLYNKNNKIDGISASTLDVKFNKSNIIWCVLISIIAIFGFINFVGVFQKIFSSIGFSDTGGGLPLTNIGWLFLNILLAGVLPAIFEELIFRGIIFNGLNAGGFWFATIFSSLFFMFEHLSIWSVVYPIIMGIVFCLILRKTGSVIYTMIVHFCNNLIALIIDYYNEHTNSSFAVFGFSHWWEYLLAIIIAVAAFAIIYLIISKCLKGAKENLSTAYEIDVNNDKDVIETNANEQLNDVKKQRERILFWGTTSICFAFWLLMIIISYF